MNKQSIDFWKPYIELVGDEDFQRYGMMIKSLHYCGLDFSLSETPIEYLLPQRTLMLRRCERYKALVANTTLNDDDMLEIINQLVAKEYFDRVLAELVTTCRITQTDEQYWALVISAWSRQELNTAADRRANWLTVFHHRKSPASSREGLPDEFTAYRAGKTSGFSWTLDEDVARWFQQRFRQQFGAVPFHKRKFRRDDVLFYTDARNEKEVVILPLSH